MRIFTQINNGEFVTSTRLHTIKVNLLLSDIDRRITIAVNRTENNHKRSIIIHKTKTGKDQIINNERTLVFDLSENSTYHTIMNRILKDFPNSHVEETYKEQTLVYNRAVTLLANLIVSNTMIEVSDSDSRYYYTEKFIQEYTSDIKRIIKRFVNAILIRELEKSFYKSIKVLNKSEDLAYYRNCCTLFKVLTKDSDVKNHSADNLFLVRTTCSYDTAQNRINRKIRETEIQEKISSQHKDKLSLDNIIDI